MERQESSTRMTTEHNKALMRRMLDEVVAGGHLDLMDELVAPDFVNHNVVGTAEMSTTVGIDSFRQEIAALRSGFPDLTIEIVHLLADGDMVVAHVRGIGTHLGEFGGVPPTGKRGDVASITIIRIVDGKLAERWNLVDRYGMLQQLGVLPGS
jgi:steroid delta-isomerase-like uncharacterized protein